jgi:hypothetical protein
MNDMDTRKDVIPSSVRNLSVWVTIGVVVVVGLFSFTEVKTLLSILGLVVLVGFAVWMGVFKARG